MDLDAQFCEIGLCSVVGLLENNRVAIFVQQRSSARSFEDFLFGGRETSGNCFDGFDHGQPHQMRQFLAVGSVVLPQRQAVGFGFSCYARSYLLFGGLEPLRGLCHPLVVCNSSSRAVFFVLLDDEGGNTSVKTRRDQSTSSIIPSDSSSPPSAGS